MPLSWKDLRSLETVRNRIGVLMKLLTWRGSVQAAWGQWLLGHDGGTAAERRPPRGRVEVRNPTCPARKVLPVLFHHDRSRVCYSVPIGGCTVGSVQSRKGHGQLTAFDGVRYHSCLPSLLGTLEQ